MWPKPKKKAPIVRSDESILPTFWTREGEVERIKALWATQAAGGPDLVCLEIHAGALELPDHQVLEAHFGDQFHQVLGQVALHMVDHTSRAASGDWSDADTVSWSGAILGRYLTVTGWLNRILIEDVPVTEFYVLGFNQCPWPAPARVPTQVPPFQNWMKKDLDYRGPDGLRYRAESHLKDIRKGWNDWPFAGYAITEGEELVEFVWELDAPLPSVTLGDQLLTSAEAAGHDFAQGDYAFDEHVVWGGQTYRVQGLANHAPGFAPVTQMAVKQVERVRRSRIGGYVVVRVEDQEIRDAYKNEADAWVSAEAMSLEDDQPYTVHPADLFLFRNWTDWCWLTEECLVNGRIVELAVADRSP